MTPAAPGHGAVEFARFFGKQPDFVVSAPGRVNLIGDHTDYTGGLVLPIAIGRALLVVARVTDTRTITVYSAHFNETLELSLDEDVVAPAGSWLRYVAGVITLLKRLEIPLRGAELWIGGNVPPGGGLASSAALEVGVALAMLAGAGASLPRSQLAALCWQAEHEFADSPCGVMDQICCASAKADHALLIDCRTEESLSIRLNVGDCTFAVIDSGVRHAIASSEYTARRNECAVSLRRIQLVEPKLRSLRDLPAHAIESVTIVLNETLIRRVQHIATENARVAEASVALRAGDVATFGRLMDESHESLRDNFAVSCEELDTIVSIARSVDGVHGARMTGGGFGGCVVALLRNDAFEDLQAAIAERYTTGPNASVTSFCVEAVGSAGVVLNRRAE